MGQNPLWEENFIFRRDRCDPTADKIAFYSYFDSVWLPGAVIGPGGGQYAVCALILAGHEASDGENGERSYHVGEFHIGCSAYRKAWVVGSEPLRRKAFMLHHNRLHQLLLRQMFHAENVACALTDPARVELWVDAIHVEMAAEQDESRLAGYYMALLHELHRQSYRQSELPDSLLRALDFIERHLGDPALDRERIAVAAGLGVRTLCRQFERHLGDSPGRYLIRRRLERARQMLAMPTLSIKEIALKNGFTDPNFLTRSFHRHFGSTPGAYRRLQSVESSASR